MLTNHLRKEWRLLFSPTLLIALALAWLALGWFLLALLQEYQAIAAQLAQLENRRGATEMLLGTANDFVKWLMVLWSIFFGARSLAVERQWHTLTLYYGLSWRNFYLAKALLLTLALLLLTLPFWLTAGGLAAGVSWDKPLLLSYLLGQLFFIVFAVGLSLTISAGQSQGLSASLLTALCWLLLWLSPTLSSTPPWLPVLMRYLSPFEHFQLLQQGILSVQTIFYAAFTTGIFIMAVPYFWQEKP